MAVLVFLFWILLIGSALAVVGFSTIFKLHASLRYLWATIIFIGLAFLLVYGVQDALHDSQIPARSAEQQRTDFIDEAIRNKPWMNRDDFN